jgi:phage terminase large subunit
LGAVSTNPLIDFVKTYHSDPVSFVRCVLGAEPDPWQASLLADIANGTRRITVRSGHGVGKSTVVAWAALWYILTRFPVKIVVTAPSAPQLFDALFPEIKRWISELPPQLQGLLEVKSERIELRAAPDESFISARTSKAEHPEAMAGVHSENVMLIADEASGIPDAVFEAGAGSMSGRNAVTILTGNPLRPSGLFYRTHNPAPDTPPELLWKRYHVSCLDSPRVSKEFIEESKSQYGEESNSYRVRVLGEFPKEGDNSIIGRDLIEAARYRDLTGVETTPIVWGLDVARFGSDRSALVKRQGNSVIEAPRTWAGLDTMQLTGAVMSEYEATDLRARPLEILVDSIGIGAGVADRLRELGMPVRGINVSETPAVRLGNCLNLRAELWLKAKAWFESRNCRIPPDPRLIEELAEVRYKFTDTGKLQVESKDQIRKRLRRSTDVADAFVLTFASEAATAIHGWSPVGSWAKPLRRMIPGIV